MPFVRAIRSDEISAPQTIHGGNYTLINSFNKTKFSEESQQRSEDLIVIEIFRPFWDI